MPSPRAHRLPLVEEDERAARLLFVAGWRHMVMGNANCPTLYREFQKRCGARTQSVFEGLFVFLLLLGHGSRRRLAIGHPGCPGLTRHEVQVLSLLSAAQAGHDALFEANLCWLVRSEARAGVGKAAASLAGIFAMCGVSLACD